MMVSINVCVIDTSPCRTGWLVCAAAAAIAADPRPDSLENMPRATPYWMTMMIAEPTKPPGSRGTGKGFSKDRGQCARQSIQIDQQNVDSAYDIEDHHKRDHSSGDTADRFDTAH